MDILIWTNIIRLNHRKKPTTHVKKKEESNYVKTSRRLQYDNICLNAENKELKRKIQEQSKLIEATETYRNEHQKALTALNDTKERYNEAIRDVVAEKKRYRKECEKCLKRI